MIVQGFSIDPRGEWSESQMRRVRKLLNEEAHERGLQIEFHAVNVSTFNRPSRYLIHVYCTKHKHLIAYDNACELCLREEKRLHG